MHKVSADDGERVIKVDDALNAKLEKAFAKPKKVPKPSPAKESSERAGEAAANRGRSDSLAGGAKVNILDLEGDWQAVFATSSPSKVLANLELSKKAFTDVMALIKNQGYKSYTAVQKMLLQPESDLDDNHRELIAELASLAQRTLIATPDEAVLGENFLTRLYEALKNRYPNPDAETAAADLPVAVYFFYQLRASGATLLLALAVHRQQTTDLSWALKAFLSAYESAAGVCKAVAESASVKTLRDNLYILARHMLPQAKRARLEAKAGGVAVAWDFPAFIREVEKYETTASNVARHTLLYFLVTAVRDQGKDEDKWLQDAADTLRVQSETLRDSSQWGVLALRMITVKALDAAYEQGTVEPLREAVLGPKSPLLVAAVRLESDVKLAAARAEEVETYRDMLAKVWKARLDAGHRYEELCVKLGMKSATELTEREDALVALDVLRKLLATAMEQSSKAGP